MAKLYGARARQDELLTEHLPTLLAAFDPEPPWWVVRFRDPDPHLRIRLTLPTPDAFGPAASIISTWAERLHHAGLLRELQYATSFPEVGRWGDGPAWEAAEGVFRADSAVVLDQLRDARDAAP